MSDLPTVTGPVRDKLRGLGITKPDPGSELHLSLVDTFTRLGEAPIDVLMTAIMWCYHAELDRQINAYAKSKVEYDRVLGAGVIRYRAQGEKSAEVAKMKAESVDEGVYLARLEYLKSEQMINSCKAALQILHAQLSAWQTNRADARKADEIHTQQ